MYHTGTSKVKTDIHRDTINAYAHTPGLTGVFMISIDEDWSALRVKATISSHPRKRVSSLCLLDSACAGIA